MSVFAHTNHASKSELHENENNLLDLFANRKYGIGVYKGTVVFLKRVCKKSIDLTRNVRRELIQVGPREQVPPHR